MLKGPDVGMYPIFDSLGEGSRVGAGVSVGVTKYFYTGDISTLKHDVILGESYSAGGSVPISPSGNTGAGGSLSYSKGANGSVLGIGSYITWGRGFDAYIGVGETKRIGGHK